MTVYGGPASASNTARETFVTPNATAEYGFLILNLDSRARPGRASALLDDVYLKLGQVEIDDMAEGVKALWSRARTSTRARVGIYGTSYGGYASVMSILRHPEVFAAASASSPVTAWYHYDTIYTERYMWIPQENKEGYEAGSAMTYAKDLKGRLMLYYGTADNNVHPSNTMQLIKALQEAARASSAGRPGSRAQRRQSGSDDGVLHREPDRAAGDGNGDLLSAGNARRKWVRGRLLQQTSSRHPQGTRCIWPIAKNSSGQGFEQCDYPRTRLSQCKRTANHERSSLSLISFATLPRARSVLLTGSTGSCKSFRRTFEHERRRLSAVRRE